MNLFFPDFFRTARPTAAASRGTGPRIHGARFEIERMATGDLVPDSMSGPPKRP